MWLLEVFAQYKAEAEAEAEDLLLSIYSAMHPVSKSSVCKRQVCNSSYLQYANLLIFNRYLEHKLKRSGSSPTESIIQDLGTVNTRVKDIVKVLEEMGHIEAIKVLLPGKHTVLITTTFSQECCIFPSDIYIPLKKSCVL